MPLTPSDITDGSTAVFDVLMNAVDAIMTSQFDLNRLTGADYAAVYTGAIQTAIQASVSFANMIAEMDIKEAQSAKDLTIKEAQEALVNAQITKTTLESTAISTGTSIKSSQSSQDLALKQAQEALVINQAATEIHTATLTAQKAANAIKEEALLDKQILKTEAEEELLDQKTISEWAQTELTSLSTGNIAGIIGSQVNLYSYQAAGFQHKAANDALKSFTDLYNVFMVESNSPVLPPGESVADTISLLIFDMVKEIYANADASSPSFVVGD